MTTEHREIPSATSRDRLDSETRSHILPYLLCITLLGMPALLYWIGRTQVRWELQGEAGQPREEAKGEAEFLIGDFHERNLSFPSTPVAVDLKLFTDIPPEQSEKYNSAMQEKEGEIRGAVSSVIRSVPTSDLREPTLATLKRKMKVAMNNAYGRETDLFDRLLIPEFDAYPVN